MKWEKTAVSIVGENNKKSETECEDSYCIYDGEKFIIVAVSDGAGSAKYAKEGSNLAVDFSIEFLKSKFDCNNISISIIEDIFNENILQIKREIGITAEKLECNEIDLSATLLIAIVTENIFAGFQIGDGGIVYRDAECDDFKCLTIPQHGMFINQTNFTTNDNVNEIAEIKIIEGKTDFLVAISDGMENFGIKYKDYTPFQEFYRNFYKFAYSVPDEKVRKDILKKELESDKICKYTDDDKTMAIIYNRKPESV